MICHAGVNFAEDIDTFQFYGLDAPEDLVSIEPMSGHGKQHHYDMSILGMNFPHSGGMHDSGVLSQFMHPSYTAHMTNQQDLAALPQGFGLDFDDDSTYTQTYDYPASRVGSVISTTRPSVAVSSDHPQSVGAIANPTLQQSKKRKASFDSQSDDEHVPKKVAVALQDTNGEFHDLSGEPSPYSSFVPTPAAAPMADPYTRRLSGSPRTASHQYSTSNASLASLPAPSPYTPTVSPAFTTANTDQSPRAPATPAPRPASASPYGPSNPKLVRTSTISSQQSPPGVTACVGIPGQTHAFNPYTMYSPNAKARLTLDGDLNELAKNWTPEELEARRKIVVFSRSQKGNEIFADFKVVSQKEWSRQPGTVNCIWWKERNDAFVTSVDTIQLLEELVHVRFTVEEKNRIRRNLEGFKPLTVSKAKADSEEFFKVIMGFPNPKPRNIEKDVKVFPWRILQTALCKIISKYSASYASTAATLSGAPAQLYRPVETPEFHYAVSPGQDYNGPVPHMVQAYEPEMPQGRMSAPVTPTPNLQIMPTATQAYDIPQHYGYPQVSVQVSHPHYQQQAMTAPATHGNPYWNFNFSTEGQVSMTPASAPPTAYPPREMIETADFGGVPTAPHMMHR